MRYFRIYADKQNIQPRFLNWNSLVRPGVRQGDRIYGELDSRNYLKVELDKEIQFMDIISSPCFMVSKELADLIRLYSPGMRFRHMVLFDEQNRRAVSYQIPDLPEVDCLYEGSELSRDGSVIRKGILCGEKTEEQPIFRLKGAEGRYIMANLEFIESAYRREVKGMGIEEFVVR